VTVADADPDGDAVDTDRLRADGEARLDFLIDRGLLVEHGDDTVAPSEPFENTRAIYDDTYGDTSDEQFHETVADLFDLTREEAATRAEELGLTRWELATFLAVRSELSVDLPQDLLSELAAIMVAAGEASPVPPGMQDLPADYEAFLADHGDAVVFVFARDCNPCRKMKDELDEIRAAAPDGVAFAGADGGEATDLRRAYGVEVAPTVLVFAGGSLAEKIEGYTTPEDLGEAFAGAY
jgi:thiol-disulfide isomerase/thioredoxin